MTKTDTRTILFLLNDTDIILLNVIKRKFKNQVGWESIISTNYDEAVQACRKQKPDSVLTEIIISDQQGRTGFDFITEIKSKKLPKKPEIIIFTDLRQEEDMAKARDLGVHHYFIKSRITLNDLIKEIQKIIG